uniref:5-hydroxytryptamine (serotonin) receptor 3A n=1 Tax=Hucho hucho TaxID=62062 RepID=A0A4W5LWS0_9TELE
MVMDQVGFYLPPDSGERVSFKITLLLGYSVFLIIVSDTLPTTVIGMPLIGVYFVVCMALLVISLTETVLIVRLVHKQDLQPHVHQWLKHLVLERVTVLLCIRNTHSLCSMLSRDYDHLGHYKENNISQALCNHHHHHTCRIDRGGKDSMERGLGAWWSCPWCVTPGSLSWTTSCTRSRPSAASWRRKKSAGTLPRSGCRWATCWTCCFSGSTWWPCWPTASPWGPPGPCGSTHERLTVEEGLTVDVEGLIVEQGLMM